MDYIACQAPLSIGFSRQEYWSRLPCPPPGDLPDPQIKPVSLRSPALAARFFTTRAIWETHLNTTMKSESRSVVTNSFRPHGLCSPWNSPGQNTGACSLSLLQGIFPTRDRTQVSHIAGGFFTI